jgi:signal transduction histidine kinase
VLHEFVTANRDDLIRRCRAKVQARSVPPPTPAELELGIPRFLDQLAEALRGHRGSDLEMDRSAAQHGRDLQLQGFSVSQVVHDYGDVCQSITDLAVETGAPISVEDFRTLNGCLDDAIASAVTEYGRARLPVADGADTAAEEERFGFFAHELRNLVNTASIALEVLDTGSVGLNGSTGGVLRRSLSGLRDVINRSVAEVRLRSGLHARVYVVVPDLVKEVAAAGALEAAARDLRLTVQVGEPDVAVYADRQILAAVLVNLLQNAFKFTRPRTSVALNVTATADRVSIEVADECGGLRDGDIDDLFRPFEQRHPDRSGLGLGLAFSRWGAAINEGLVVTRNLPGHGCVFSVDLPRVPMPDRTGFGTGSETPAVAASDVPHTA